MSGLTRQLMGMGGQWKSRGLGTFMLGRVEIGPEIIRKISLMGPMADNLNFARPSPGGKNIGV